MIQRPAEAQVDFGSKVKTEFELGEERRALLVARWKCEQSLSAAAQRIASFDSDVHNLFVYKAMLDEELILAQLRLDTLQQELLLLKDFEKRENAILNRVETKEAEIDDVRQKVQSSKVKFDSKKKEVEKLSEKEKQILVEFQRLVGENNKFEAYLTKGN